MRDCGYATASGANGVRLAGKVNDTLADPARYAPGTTTASGQDGQLFEFDEWLERQRQAKVPVIPGFP